MYRRYYRKGYPFTYAVYFNCSFSCVNRMSTFYSRLEFLLYRVDNIFRSTELPLSSWYVWHKWSNCWSPCSSTHALTLAHLSTWCPIFLLAHQNCDACSVRRVCQWITMHPFSQQTAPPPSSPSEVKHKYCCLLWKQPWQNILTSYLFLALVFSRECFSLLYLRPPQKNLGHFEAVLAGIVCGEIMVIMSPTKSMLLHTLQRPLPSAMIASSVSLTNHTDVLIDTGQTLLRWLMDEINEFPDQSPRLNSEIYGSCSASWL